MTTAAMTADYQTDRNTDAGEDRTPLPLRGDTLLGVCEAVGQDLGFNPNWLRIAFASLLLWNAEAVIVAYLGLGLVVAVSRWFFPVNSRKQSAAPAVASDHADETEEEEELLAA